MVSFAPLSLTAVNVASDWQSIPPACSIVHTQTAPPPAPPPANASCPVCPHGRNSVLTVRLHHAGLGDRLSVLYGMSSLAARLCARFDPPPPCALLTSAHNLGSLNCSIAWSRYTATDEVRTAVDGESVFLEALARSRSGMLNRSDLLGPDPARMVTAANVSAVKQTFAKAIDLMEAGRPFHWAFLDYYGWKYRLLPEMLKGFSEQCVQRGPTPPSFVDDLATEFVAYHLCSRSRSSLLLSIHLRWRDTLREAGYPQCNVSEVGRAADRISHLLKDASQMRNLSLEHTSPRLVVFSDWPDRTYLRNLTTLLPVAMSMPQLRVHLGDEEIEVWMRGITQGGASLMGDNYALYQVGLSVMMRADVHVQWRGCTSRTQNGVRAYAAGYLFSRISTH